MERPQSAVRNRRIGWERWRMECPQKSAWNRPPARSFQRVGALARGASVKFSATVTTLSLFSAGVLSRGASLKFSARMTTFSLFSALGSAVSRIDDPLAVPLTAKKKSFARDPLLGGGEGQSSLGKSTWVETSVGSNNWVGKCCAGKCMCLHVLACLLGLNMADVREFRP